MPNKDDDFLQMMQGNKTQAQANDEAHAASSLPQSNNFDMKSVLGGYNSPEEYAMAHANWASQQKSAASGGHYTVEDAKADVENYYKMGNDIVQKERDRIADLQTGVVKTQLEGEINAKIDEQKQFDIKQQTRQPSADETNEASSLAYTWNGLKQLQNAYDTAHKEAPQFTGAMGGNIKTFADEHGISRALLPDAIKGFDVTAATNAGPLLQGILKYTAGADAKQSVMDELMPKLMPSLTDDPNAFAVKMRRLQDAAANRAQSFVDSRSGTNAAGNPSVDLGPVLPALQEPLQWAKAAKVQYNQQTTNTATPNSVMSPATQNAYNQLKNAANKGNGAQVVPMAPAPVNPNAAANTASPTPPPAAPQAPVVKPPSSPVDWQSLFMS